ncbi:MAG: EAL domain-containing protein [Pseudomonadota bacterium]
MKLEQRAPRYGFAVLFMAGLTGCLILAAALRQGFQPSFEVWLAAAVTALLLLYAHLGVSLSRTRQELQMLKRLAERVEEDPTESARRIAPALQLEDDANLAPEDRAMLERLRDAIDSDKLELYLQPIVSLPQRKPRFYEAFSRLRDASGGVLKPSDYLDAAERANRIGVIDNLILLRSVQALRRLNMRGGQFSVFCNISPATLYDTDFFTQFADYIEGNADLASRLIFEFTSPAVQMMHPRVEEHLRVIADKGFAFSIDHVHSLDLDWQDLRARNFRFVKASCGMLVAANRGNPESAAQLRTFRKRLADAEIDLIAEKIELEENMPEILSLGIDYGQGNLFGAPRRSEFYVGEVEAVETGLAKAS